MRFWLLILFVATTSASEIGEISELRGNGEITRVDSSETFTAELDSDIHSFDDVRTGNGRLAIQFVDDAVLRLTEHSKVVIDKFIFDPDPSKSQMAFNMASGTARFITGKLGMVNKENIRITTPTATIGIRGTDFTTTVDELGRSLVILLPNKDGSSSGEITVTTASGVEVLNEPFQATMVSTWETPPTRPVTLANMTLGLIDNMLIVSRPQEVEQAVEEQQGSSTTAELDRDFFEDAPDLNCDALVEECEESEEITRLDIDLLGMDLLVDLLALVETASKKAKSNQVATISSVELTGIIAGYDPLYQTYTFVEDGLI